MKHHPIHVRWAVPAAVSLSLALALHAPLSVDAAEEQASDGAVANYFGYAGSVSGGTGLVGAYGNNGRQGAAYVFRNLDTTTGTVTQNVKLTASDGAANSFFGTAVSESSGIGLVGAYGATVGGNSNQGAAYVFRNLDTTSSTALTQNIKLTASDGAPSSYFGAAVSQSGGIGLVGAYGARVNGNVLQGAAYVYRNLDTTSSTALTQNVKLTASDGAASSYFGTAVALSGSTGLVGAYGATVGGNNAQGAAYVFRNVDSFPGTGLTQSVKLTASDGAASDYFGFAVSLSSNAGLVGAYNAKVGGNAGQGAAYLYSNVNLIAGSPTSLLTESAKLTASDGAANDNFGFAVSLAGNTGLAGADGAKIGANAAQGAVYLYSNLNAVAGSSSSLLTQNVKLVASDGSAGNNFGSSVSLDGDRFLIGARGANSNAGKSYSGTVSSVTTLDAGNATGLINGVSFVSQDNWIVGATTSGNQVTLSKGDTANVTAAGKGVFVGQNAGSNNNSLLVQGTVTAGTITVSSATGSTGNLLQVANDGGTTTAGTVAATGGIVINSGGALLLSGGGMVSDRIGNTTPVTLNGGGSFSTGGLNEGTAPTSAGGSGGAVGVGALTLAATSAAARATVDFGSAQTGSALIFSSLAASGKGAYVNVLDYTGTANGVSGDNGAATNDRLLFTADPGYTQADLANWQFSNDAGTAIATGGTEIGFNGYYEIVPVPEPATWLGGALAGLAALRRARRESLFPASQAGGSCRAP